jgi:uncharacterized protein YvpB
MKLSSFYHFLRRLIVCTIVLALLWPVSVLAKEKLPARAYIFGVNGHPQKYPLSCESRSAVDWAAYWGVTISEKKFLNNLPRSDNPEKGFVGQPMDSLGQIPPQSYGVHAGPVADLLRKFGLDAQAQRGFSWDQLKAEISAKRPVIVWVIGEMWKGTPVGYTASDGEKITVAAYEHTMLLVGYAPNYVIAIDATTGLEGSYPLAAFKTSWEVLGRMAVTGGVSQVSTPTIEMPAITQQPMETEVTPTPEIEVQARTTQKFYIVRRGEYLTGIAKRLGIGWRLLAKLNNLTTPYILYTGQKLRLP